MRRLSLIKRVITGTVRDLAGNNTFSFAAALSYYFVMAFFPAMIALAAVVAYLPIPNLFQTIVATMTRIAPPESMGLIRKVVGDVISPSRGAFLGSGIVGALWTCSSGFSTIIEALNLTYDIRETRPLWKTRLITVELTLLTGSLITFAFAFMIVGPRFGEFLAVHLGLTHEFAVAWPILRYIIAVSFMVVAIEVLYSLAPDLRQRWTSLLPGAIVAVVGWILSSDALSFYFQSFAYLNRTYGALGGGVAFLIWLYWSGFLILLGAQLNCEIRQQRTREGSNSNTERDRREQVA